MEILGMVKYLFIPLIIAIIIILIVLLANTSRALASADELSEGIAHVSEGIRKAGEKVTYISSTMDASKEVSSMLLTLMTLNSIRKYRKKGEPLTRAVGKALLKNSAIMR